MNIYLNGELIYEDAHSIKVQDNVPCSYDAKGIEYCLFRGKPFIVTIILNDSIEKEYKVRKCQIVYPFYYEEMTTKPIKVYLNN